MEPKIIKKLLTSTYTNTQKQSHPPLPPECLSSLVKIAKENLSLSNAAVGLSSCTFTLPLTTDSSTVETGKVTAVLHDLKPIVSNTILEQFNEGVKEEEKYEEPFEIVKEEEKHKKTHEIVEEEEENDKESYILYECIIS